MAKKEKKEASPLDDFTERFGKQVKADYGEGVFISGQAAIDQPQMVIPISPTLDIITSGGLREGSWFGITGNPKTTKTNLALCLAATCQRPEHGSRRVYYAKVEGRLSVAHFKGIAGLDFGRLNIIQSRKGRILTAQDYLRLCEQILREVPGAVLIMDSISSLCDEREMVGGVGTETRGAGAKVLSQWLNTMSNVVPVNDSIVIGITHMMCNTSGLGPHYIEKATRRWHYQCDYQLRTVGKEAWVAGEKQIGFKIDWLCNASPLGPPGGKVTSYVRFGTGIDCLFEALEFGVACKLVQQNGAWYSLDFLASDAHKDLGVKAIPKAQGGEAVYKLLKQNPDWARALQQDVVQMAMGA